jgi:sulfite exporter TauE/SafE/plastocyanin domain-containing protein/copper chaperone CopZ
MSKQNKINSSTHTGGHKRKIVPIKGMHCRSCEILIEEELLKVDGIHKVSVSEKKGIAEIFYEGDILDSHIENAVCSCGYSIGKDNKSWISKNPRDYDDLIKAAIALVAVYFIAKGLGLFNITFSASNNLASLPVVLLVGLTAGLSTCMALVGGLVLGVSARFSEKHPNATPTEKFKPHILFNLGRVFFFIIFGAIIGYFGSFLQLGTSAVGFLTILVGIVMLLLGLQTTAIFPKLEKIRFTLPKGLYKLAGVETQKESEYSNKGSFLLGGLTFFLPCGFTQAMQLYAISSGSPITGALTMGVFALGTAPGLLGVGGLTSIIKGAFAKPFFKFVGLMVVALSLFNISNGLNLTGLGLPAFGGLSTASANSRSVASDPNVNFQNGVQIVRMTQGYNGYSPRSFTIQKGVPVKWIITSTDVNTCAASIFSSQLGLRKILNEGENIIEFTPNNTGTIRFSCSMGMFTGSFNVIDGSISYSNSGGTNNKLATAPAPSNPQAGGSCGGSGGGCGYGGSLKNVQTSANTPAIKPDPALVTDDSNTQTQLIKATYTVNSDIQPNNFTVKANQPVRFEIEAKEDGYGCMGSVALPGLANDYYPLQKDQKTVFNFNPSKTGTYQITCAMGVPRGTITVQ